MSAVCFRLTTRDGHPVPHAGPIPGCHAHCTESAQRWWLPVIAAHVGWPLLSTASNISEEAIAHSTSPPPIRAHSSLLCFVLAAASPAVARRRGAAPSCLTGPKGAPCHRAPPTPRPCLQRRKPGHDISPSSSSSVNASPATARSDYSPTRQQASLRQGAPPRPPLRPPRPLLRPLTGVSSPSTRAPPQMHPLSVSTPLSTSPPRFSSSSK
jgi:hypothetical protein